MKAKSVTKNQGGEIIGEATIEEISLRRSHWRENHREEIIEEVGIWEASGSNPGGIWEASGKHLGLQEAMGLQEALGGNYCNTS